MTLVLAAKKKFWMLSLGVVIASAIFDGLYIVVGVILGKIEVKPTYTILITVGVLIMVWLLNFGVRYIVKLRRQAHESSVEKT
jgi:uncharacterized membrane protein